MNKTLKSILKNIEIHPDTSNDAALENTEAYYFIYGKLMEKEGEQTFKKRLAIKLIIEEIWREDNYRAVDFSRFKEELKELLAELNEGEISDLLSDLFGGSDKRKYEIIENFERLESKNEQAHLNFIINVLVNAIIDEINYEILLVKFKLQDLISTEEWYQFFDIRQEDFSDEEYDEEIDRVNDILSGVLK